MKYAKLPAKYKKTGWRAIGISYKVLLFNRFFYPKWLLRPICWLTKHKNRVFYPYGCKVKQCHRCGKVFYNVPTDEKKPVFNGEIGNLYGIRFIETIPGKTTRKGIKKYGTKKNSKKKN